MRSKISMQILFAPFSSSTTGLQVQASEWQHGRMVQNNSSNREMMSSVVNTLDFFVLSDALEKHDGKLSTGGRSTCV